MQAVLKGNPRLLKMLLLATGRRAPANQSNIGGGGGADICDLQTKDKRSKCSEVDLVSSAEMNIWAAVTSSRQLTQKGNFDLGSVFDVSLKSV